MPSTRLVAVRSYLEPAIYTRMELARSTMRRITKSRFIEDSILERIERLERRPTQGHPRRRIMTA